MSDAKLTAQIVIDFNKETLTAFNKVLKDSEKHLKSMVTASTRLSNISRKTTSDVKKQTKSKTDAIKKETTETDRNTEAVKKNNKQTKKRNSQAAKTSAALGSLPSLIARVRVGLGLLKFVAGTAGAALAALAVPVGLVAGWTSFLDKMSRGEREFSKTARSVQVGTGFLKAFSIATKDAGLSADNAVDMLEEMSNKVGDGLETPTHGTSEAFKQLGLNLKEVQKMSRQKGLSTIMDSIVKFRKNGGNDQQTVRFADEIFGGEGNKFAGYLLETGELFSDLIAKNEKYNMISKDTSVFMDDFGNALEKTKTMAAGLVGEGLASTFERLIPVFELIQEMFIDNKDAITSTISGFAESLTTMALQVVQIFGENKGGLVIAIDTAIESMKTMLTWTENLLKGFQNIYNIYDDMSGSDTGVVKENVENVKWAVLASAEGLGDFVIDSAKQLFGVGEGSEGGGGGGAVTENSNKKSVIIHNTYNLSGENQQQVSEQTANDMEVRENE